MKVAMLNNPVVVVNPKMCGGVERMALLELDALEELGVDAKYYVRGFLGSDSRVEAMKDFRFGSDMGRRYYAWFAEKAADADVQHSQNAPLIALVSKHKNVLLHVHNVTTFPYYDLAKKNYDRCIFACCSSFILRELLRNNPSLPRERCTLLLNGIDTNLFSPSAETTPERPRILFTGAWIWHKGIRVFLDAMKILEDRGLDFEAAVAGSPYLYDTGDSQEWQSESDANIRASISQLRSARVVSVPDHSKMPDLYRSSEIYAFPSVWQEPFGLGLAEAMACGVPVVATKVGAVPEIVEDGRSGVLVEPGDPRALADAVAALIEDEGLRKRLAREGRKRIEERFSIASHARALYGIYRSMVG
uniref:Glycosyltransferase family 1 protein n=1 Tax=Candidatus Methanomethylicus mesodigestus TaxID=1867258 RepID=A0A7C3EX41_9CREN